MTEPQELNERFADWVDGCLSSADTDAIEAQLASDPELRAAAGDYAATVAMLRSALRDDEGAPRELADAVLAEMRPRSQWAWPLGVALAAAAGLLVYAVLFGPGGAGAPDARDIARGDARPNADKGADKSADKSADKAEGALSADAAGPSAPDPKVARVEESRTLPPAETITDVQAVLQSALRQLQTKNTAPESATAGAEREAEIDQLTVSRERGRFFKAGPEARGPQDSDAQPVLVIHLRAGTDPDAAGGQRSEGESVTKLLELPAGERGARQTSAESRLGLEPALANRTLAPDEVRIEAVEPGDQTWYGRDAVTQTVTGGAVFRPAPRDRAYRVSGSPAALTEYLTRLAERLVRVEGWDEGRVEVRWARPGAAPARAQAGAAAAGEGKPEGQPEGKKTQAGEDRRAPSSPSLLIVIRT